MVQMRYVNKGVSNCKVDSDVIAKMDIDLEVIIYHVKVRKYMLCIGNSRAQNNGLLQAIFRPILVYDQPNPIW